MREINTQAPATPETNVLWLFRRKTLMGHGFEDTRNIAFPKCMLGMPTTSPTKYMSNKIQIRAPCWYSKLQLHPHSAYFATSHRLSHWGSDRMLRSSLPPGIRRYRECFLRPGSKALSLGWRWEGWYAWQPSSGPLNWGPWSPPIKTLLKPLQSPMILILFPSEDTYWEPKWLCIH